MRTQSVSGRTALYAAAAAIAFAMFMVGTSAIADDSSSASSSGPANVTQADVSGQVSRDKKNAKENSKDDADKLITNNELRAMSGAKSKWSMSNAIDYYGGTISSPLGQNRPDITGGSGNTVKSFLYDQATVKYNLDATNSLSAGAGMRWIAPTSPTGPSNYNGTTFDVVNPILTYQKLANLHGVQSIFQASAMQWTQSDFTALGYNQQYSLTETTEYAFGKLSLGAVFYTQYQTFNKSGTFFDKSKNQLESVLPTQSQYEFAVYPLMEYQLTDKVNLRTLAGIAYEHYMNEGSNTYLEDTWYQSVGVGYAVSRDIFLYPNVQFLPEHMAMNLTNVALEAYINVF